jgi:thiol-disulfide isomerase/thioredoxin
VSLAPWAPLPGAARLALAPGDPAPRLRGKTIDREPFAAEWEKNKATLVNFWATWCEPCKAEMPSLQKLYAERAEQGLAIIGVLMDPVADDSLREFLDPLAVTYPIVRPHRAVNADWGGLVTFPTTFLIDAQGRIVRRYVGATPEQIAGLARDVEAFLAGQPLGTMVVPDKPSFVGDQERLKLEEQKKSSGGGSP